MLYIISHALGYEHAVLSRMILSWRRKHTKGGDYA